MKLSIFFVLLAIIGAASIVPVPQPDQGNIVDDDDGGALDGVIDVLKNLLGGKA